LTSMRAAIEAIAADPKLQGETRSAAAALLK
jgi:hypothetical protein